MVVPFLAPQIAKEKKSTVGKKGKRIEEKNENAIGTIHAEIVGINGQ